MNKTILSVFGVCCLSSIAWAKDSRPDKDQIRLDDALTYTAPTNPPSFQANLQHKTQRPSRSDKQGPSTTREVPSVPLKEYNNGGVFGDQ